MSIMNELPPEFRKAIREGAERDLEDMRNRINLMAAEAKGLPGFDNHMSLMTMIMMKFMKDPITLAMMFTEAIYLLAEKGVNTDERNGSQDRS